MKISIVTKGIVYASLGSLWWGIIGTIYFQYFSFIGHIELVVHRCLWTTLVLLITVTLFNKKKIIYIIHNRNINF